MFRETMMKRELRLLESDLDRAGNLLPTFNAALIKITKKKSHNGRLMLMKLSNALEVYARP